MCIDSRFAEEPQAPQRAIPVESQIAPDAVILLITVIVLDPAAVGLVVTIRYARDAEMPTAALQRNVRASHIFVHRMTFRPFRLGSMQAIGDYRGVTAIHDAGIHGRPRDKHRRRYLTEIPAPPQPPEKIRLPGRMIFPQARTPAGGSRRRTENRQREGFPQNQPLPETGRKVAGIPAFVAGGQGDEIGKSFFRVIVDDSPDCEVGGRILPFCGQREAFLFPFFAKFGRIGLLRRPFGGRFA